MDDLVTRVKAAVLKDAERAIDDAQTRAAIAEVFDWLEKPSEVVVRLGGCKMDDGDDGDTILVWQAMLAQARIEALGEG